MKIHNRVNVAPRRTQKLPFVGVPNVQLEAEAAEAQPTTILDQRPPSCFRGLPLQEAEEAEEAEEEGEEGEEGEESLASWRRRESSCVLQVVLCDDGHFLSSPVRLRETFQIDGLSLKYQLGPALVEIRPKEENDLVSFVRSVALNHRCARRRV